MTYTGLILDFGGVVTTDLFAQLAAFCQRAGLAPDAFARALREDGAGRAAVAAVETGKIPPARVRGHHRAAARDR